MYIVLVKGGKDIADERPKTLFLTSLAKYRKELKES